MDFAATDVMKTDFRTLHPDVPISEAVNIFLEANAREGRRVFGLMVTDDDNHLVGMLSMYDIMLFMRPKHIHIWGMMEDIDVDGIIENACERIKPLRVGDLMTAEVVTITPKTHLMMILDIMVKKHIRRLPVLDEGKIVGIVYFSDLFNHVLDRLTCELPSK
jgi:CBS domain-containing protein